MSGFISRPLFLEFHANSDTLRREIWTGGDEGPRVPLLRSGVFSPQERKVRLDPSNPAATTGSLGMYHHGHGSDMQPVSLGWFRIHEIDYSEPDPPMATITITARRKLEATAVQGSRRLPVTWSHYRVVSVENDPGGA